LGVRIRSELAGRWSLLPWSFEPFQDAKIETDVDVVIRSSPRLEPAEGRLVFHSALHWRVFDGESVEFELFHPPTERVYCRMTASVEFSRAEITFAEEAWLGLGADEREWLVPHPLDQLLLVPALAVRGAVLLHASGASFEDRAMVFAGHSGDGKTTLARLLASEGIPLLSDERIAIRRSGDGFVAHGTPWPGEGNVASPASHPLAALFVLRKAGSHFIERTPGAVLAPELLARAIVPYYLPGVAARILSLFDDLLREVPVHELHFSREPGLKSLLQAA
jgi:hypothetical protein